jgi:hypothetical protein
MSWQTAAKQLRAQQEAGERVTTARRLIELPLSLPPRGLTRLEASRYVGVSPNKFDEAVKVGKMPKPRRLLGVDTWDRLALDRAYSALPTDEGGNSWDGH